MGRQEPARARENQALGRCHASKGRPSGLGSTRQERKQKEQRACGKGEGQQVAGSSEAKKKKQQIGTGQCRASQEKKQAMLVVRPTCGKRGEGQASRPGLRLAAGLPLLGLWPGLLAWAPPGTYLGQDLGQERALSPEKK